MDPADRAVCVVQVRGEHMRYAAVVVANVDRAAESEIFADCVSGRFARVATAHTPWTGSRNGPSAGPDLIGTNPMYSAPASTTAASVTVIGDVRAGMRTSYGRVRGRRKSVNVETCPSHPRSASRMHRPLKFFATTLVVTLSRVRQRWQPRLRRGQSSRFRSRLRSTST